MASRPTNRCLIGLGVCLLAVPGCVVRSPYPLASSGASGVAGSASTQAVPTPQDRHRRTMVRARPGPPVPQPRPESIQRVPPMQAPTTPAMAPQVMADATGTISEAPPASAYRPQRAAAVPVLTQGSPGFAPTPPSTPTQHPTRSLSHRQLYGELPGPALAAAATPLDDEGNLRRVTFTTEGADFDIAADLAGRRLVYASTRHRERADLYLQDVGGTAVTQLTTDPARDEMPALSPDGNRLAFASDRAGNFDIYLMDLAGGPAVKLTDDGSQNIHPSFSPDGTRLVYCSLGSRSGVWEIVLLDLDRPGHRRIIGHGLFPTWSPSDNRIAFQRARQRGSRWFSVWTLDIDNDGQPSRPTEIIASGNAAVITPQWSPDGSQLVFCTVLDPTADSPVGSRADIWICNADGTGRTRLTHGRYGNLQPTWAADGSIYFVSDRGAQGIENIYSLRPDQAVFLARQQQRPPGNSDLTDTAEATVPTPITD